MIAENYGYQVTTFAALIISGPCFSRLDKTGNDLQGCSFVLYLTGIIEGGHVGRYGSALIVQTFNGDINA